MSKQIIENTICDVCGQDVNTDDFNNYEREIHKGSRTLFAQGFSIRMRATVEYENQPPADFDMCVSCFRELLDQ